VFSPRCGNYKKYLKVEQWLLVTGVGVRWVVRVKERCLDIINAWCVICGNITLNPINMHNQHMLRKIKNIVKTMGKLEKRPLENNFYIRSNDQIYILTWRCYNGKYFIFWDRLITTF
jgi:hypothetical protein